MKKLFLIVSLLILASMILPACAPQIVKETVVVTQVVEKPGEVKEVEKVVEKVVEVTSTPAPEAPKEAAKAKDPKSFVYAIYGEPPTLDPGWGYDTAEGLIVNNVYETLAFFKRQKASEFVPQLAEKWEISPDGKTYTFTIRKGVKFHNGDELTAEDVAYTYQRNLLQGGANSPMLLWTEPVYGIGIQDVSDVVMAKAKLKEAVTDDREKLSKVDPVVLEDVCNVTKEAIKADNAAGTVVVTLAQPFAMFLATTAHQSGAILDKKWAVENKAWDGDCKTWQNYYSVTDETSPLSKIMNGTGPFKFDHWTPGEEIVLTKNENYWRTEPAWEGGPSGLAKFDSVIIKKVDEFGTRFAMMQAGDADVAIVDLVDSTQADSLVGEICDFNAEKDDFDCKPSATPDQPLRKFQGAPGVIRGDAMFTFNIKTEGGNNLLGSGKLDGNGITPDFFNDIHVRKAFNYCMDWDTLIADAYKGAAIQGIGVLIPGMPGWDPNGKKYSFDLKKCQEEIELAWGGQLKEKGFRVQVIYNTGNNVRQTAAQILQANFRQVDPKYQIEVLAVPWPVILKTTRDARGTIFFIGWQEDVHDAHNWVQPFLVGTYATSQNLPKELKSQFQVLVDKGIAETDTAKRAEIYKQVQDLEYENALGIRLGIPTRIFYEQRFVSGFYANPMFPDDYYFYALAK
ncbi:MAG: ABC transporter substrate-binding protein [Chloroflexota bacterium]